MYGVYVAILAISPSHPQRLSIVGTDPIVPLVFPPHLVQRHFLFLLVTVNVLLVAVVVDIPIGIPLT